MRFRGGMDELMRQASRMQRKIELRREELKTSEWTGAAGNDRVKITVTGALELSKVEVDPKLLEEEGLEMVQDLLVAAANSALKNAREGVDAELEKITGGLKIPGLT